jgi:pantetheine-phosphate adenylyltransferase
MKIGVYPGTFDPITNGHLDIIKRSRNLFDKLYVVIPNNTNKTPWFTLEERIELIKEVLKDYDFVEVTTTNLLTVDFAKSVNATAMLRGLRMVSDFEYELQLSQTNNALNKDLNTVFLITKPEYSFISSSMVREILINKGDVSAFVPKVVEKYLKSNYDI